MKQDWVGTEHLLLGLFRRGEGIAARVLADLGLKYEEVKNKVTDITGSGPPPNESEG